MKVFFGSLICLMLIGCGKETRVEWWDSYKYAIVIQSPGDALHVDQGLGKKLQDTGIEVIDREKEPGDLPHDKGLVTMVVSYSYTDAFKAHLGVNLTDYTTGVRLLDSRRDQDHDRPQFTYSESNAGFQPLEKRVQEMVDNFGKWFSARHLTFNRDAVLLRPRWWTNESRKTEDKP